MLKKINEIVFAGFDTFLMLLKKYDLYLKNSFRMLFVLTVNERKFNKQIRISL